MDSETRKYPNEEPGADVRQAASAVRQMFVALVQEGFSEYQALIIVGQVVTASIKGKPDA